MQRIAIQLRMINPILGLAIRRFSIVLKRRVPFAANSLDDITAVEGVSIVMKGAAV